MTPRLSGSSLPVLECRSRATESALLREAGDERPCARGRGCRGVRDWRLIPGMPGPRVLLSANYLIGEWDDGSPVAGDAPEACVLCQRHEALETGGPTAWFNARGGPDGYDPAWFVPARAPCALPVLSAPLHMYRARPGAALWLDQSALFAPPPPAVFPEMGELVHHFLKHAAERRARLAESGERRREDAVCAAVPLEPLLAPHRAPRDPMFWCPGSVPLLFADAERRLHVDLPALRRLVDRAIPGLCCADAYYLRACQVHDMLPADAAGDAVPLDRLQPDELVTDASVDPAAQQWFAAPRGAPPEPPLITREARRDAHVYDTSFFRLCAQALVCTLLGNYPRRRRDTSPSAAQRQRVCAFFRDPASERWLARFFLRCPPAVHVVLRDMALHQWGHRPWLWAELRRRLDVPAFRRVTLDAVDRLRAHFFEGDAWLGSVRGLPARPAALHQLWTCGIPECGLPCPHVLLHPARFARVRAAHLAAMRGARGADDLMDACLELALPEEADEHEMRWRRPAEFARYQADRAEEERGGWSWASTPWHDALRASLGARQHEHWQRPTDPGWRAHVRLKRRAPPADRERAKRQCVELGGADALAARLGAARPGGWRAWARQHPRAVEQLAAALQWEREAADAPRVVPLSRSLAAAQRRAQRGVYGERWGEELLSVAYCAGCRRLATPVVDERGRHMGLSRARVSCRTRVAACEDCGRDLEWWPCAGSLVAVQQRPHGFCPLCGYLCVVEPERCAVLGQCFVCAACAREAAPVADDAALWRRRVAEGACAVADCARRPRGRPLTIGSAHWLAAHGFEFARNTRHGDVFVCARHFKPAMLRLADPADDDVDRCWREA